MKFSMFAGIQKPTDAARMEGSSERMRSSATCGAGTSSSLPDCDQKVHHVI
eukprot:CAMPEP_0119416574 /NCGR_PEP_ID=MMETSP1335-20130426/13297_1 /TAXON_ID=259385 /ORGANISM="Chrysoculter rhomboideus, Strain RCC1486" /LENGTH=50 /DNA_ID=CAMNT_0007441705 /DNA_START=600 /DNA_END=752 /DNA_ORIENTATION=-